MTAISPTRYSAWLADSAKGWKETYRRLWPRGRISKRFSWISWRAMGATSTRRSACWGTIWRSRASMLAAGANLQAAERRGFDRPVTTPLSCAGCAATRPMQGYRQAGENVRALQGPCLACHAAQQTGVHRDHDRHPGGLPSAGTRRGPSGDRRLLRCAVGALAHRVRRPSRRAGSLGAYRRAYRADSDDYPDQGLGTESARRKPQLARNDKDQRRTREKGNIFMKSVDISGFDRLPEASICRNSAPLQYSARMLCRSSALLGCQRQKSEPSGPRQILNTSKA